MKLSALVGAVVVLFCQLASGFMIAPSAFAGSSLVSPSRMQNMTDGNNVSSWWACPRSCTLPLQPVKRPDLSFFPEAVIVGVSVPLQHV